MKSLRDWSGRRVAAVAAVWLFGLPLLVAPAVFGAVGWLARTERARSTAVPDSLAPALRVTYGPLEAGDLPVSFDGPGAMLLVGLFLLPPLALCLAWAIARRRSDRSSPAAAANGSRTGARDLG